MKLKNESVNIPDEYRCPISREIMSDPVITEDGHSYERTEIETWFAQSSMSPLTGLALSSKVLIPNHNLRNAIELFIEKENEDDAREMIEQEKKAREKLDFEYAAKLSIEEFNRHQLNEAKQEGWEVQGIALQTQQFQKKIPLPCFNFQNEKNLRQINLQLAHDPHNSTLVSIKINLLIQLNRPEEALICLNDIIEKIPSNILFLSMRARLLRDLGFLDRALKDFQSVLYYDPLNSYAQFGENLIRQLISKKEQVDHHILLSATSQRQTIQPNIAFPRSQQINDKATKLKSQGLLGEALAELNIGLKHDPKNIYLLWNRGDVYLKMKNYSSALHNFEMILDIKPGDLSAIVGKQAAQKAREKISTPRQKAEQKKEEVPTTYPSSSAGGVSIRNVVNNPVSSTTFFSSGQQTQHSVRNAFQQDAFVPNQRGFGK